MSEPCGGRGFIWDASLPNHARPCDGCPECPEQLRGLDADLLHRAAAPRHWTDNVGAALGVAGALVLLAVLVYLAAAGR